MGVEWRQARLGDLVEIFDGPHATPQKAASGPVFLGISSLSCGRLDLSQTEHISEKDFAVWTRRVTPSACDVVFSYETRLGEVAFIPPGLRCCLGRRLGLLRARADRVIPRFLLYAYLGPEFQETIRQRKVHGSTVDRIPLVDMPDFPIRIPDLRTQSAVANILGTLDDKIELNRRINETLEASARAVFRSWFIDFDPVRANVEGRAPAGMGAETAKLFPSEFVQSEQGEIPQGWRVGTVGEFVDLQRGATYKSGLKGADGPVLLGLGTIQRNGGFREDKLVTYGGDSPEKLLVAPGELFVSLKDVTQSADLLGAVARVPRHVKRGRLTQDTVKLVFKGSPDIGELMYQTLLTQEYRDFCRQHATGTTNLGLSREDFLSYPVMVCPPPILAAFNEVLRPITSRMELQMSESNCLACLRDTLLPRLLSGELSVADAESAI